MDYKLQSTWLIHMLTCILCIKNNYYILSFFINIMSWLNLCRDCFSSPALGIHLRISTSSIVKFTSQEAPSEDISYFGKLWLSDVNALNLWTHVLTEVIMNWMYYGSCFFRWQYRGKWKESKESKRQGSRCGDSLEDERRDLTDSNVSTCI